MAAHPPCPKCGSTGRHKMTCERLKEIESERKAAAARQKPPAVVARVTGARAAAAALDKAAAAVNWVRVTAVRPLEGKTVTQLLDLKAEAQHQVEAVEIELRARQEELAAALEGRAIRATTPALAAGG